MLFDDKRRRGRRRGSMMCDYTQVEYACGHLRFTVRAWCEWSKKTDALLKLDTDRSFFTGIKYQESHKRCPPNVVAIEYRLNEKCGMAPLQSRSMHHCQQRINKFTGDCRESTSPRFTVKRKPSSICKPPSPEDTPKKKERPSTPAGSK